MTDAALTIARAAARLFLEQGVSGTSADDIAAAAGLSRRTIWRHFPSKESSVGPLFAASALRFIDRLRHWPADLSLEAFLAASYADHPEQGDEITDGTLALRLIERMEAEPALRPAWLMACQAAEQALVPVIAGRLGRSVDAVEVRLCAATVIAATRVIDEAISRAALRYKQPFTLDDALDRLAWAIRAASTLPICDPVVPQVWPTQPSVPQPEEKTSERPPE